MTRFLTALFVVLWGSALAQEMLPAAVHKNGPTADMQWSLLVLSEIRGEVAPCDCQGVPVGGVDRMARLLRRFREVHPREQVFLLAMGSHFAVGDVIYRERARYLRGFLERHEAAVVTAGPRDYEFGLPFLEWYGSVGQRFLKLNLRTSDGAEPPPEHAVLQVLGPDGDFRRISLVGAVDPDFLPVATPPFLEFSYTEPGPYLEASIAALPESALTIALITATKRNAAKLGRRVPGIDLVIGAEGDRHDGLDQSGKGPPIFFGGGDLRYLGILRFWERDGAMVIRDARVIPLDEELMPDDAEEPLLGRFLYEEGQLRQQLHRNAHPDLARSSWAGSDACASCHRDIHATWKGSPHAQSVEATDSLPQLRDFLKEHFPKFRSYHQQERFDRADAPAVQCETCHGPALEHVRAPQVPYPWAPAREACAGCHTIDQRKSPAYKQAIESLRHWSAREGDS